MDLFQTSLGLESVVSHALANTDPIQYRCLAKVVMDASMQPDCELHLWQARQFGLSFLTFASFFSGQEVPISASFSCHFYGDDAFHFYGACDVYLHRFLKVNSDSVARQEFDCRYLSYSCVFPRSLQRWGHHHSISECF